MPRFKLEVYPEPKDGKWCGACRFFHIVTHRMHVDEFRCSAFDVQLGASHSPLRCSACIDAERKANEDAKV